MSIVLRTLQDTQAVVPFVLQEITLLFWRLQFSPVLFALCFGTFVAWIVVALLLFVRARTCVAAPLEEHRPARFVRVPRAPRPLVLSVCSRWERLVRLCLRVRFLQRTWGLLGQYLQQIAAPGIRSRLIAVYPTGRQ